ncbi:hypothetical protein MOQ_003644 [Trypanosoma cruzi marinkellei]|uniref:Uncharacterized protein n=1 Tax=Trypanosoma cruzi marinkellei TaxID=85056 RepID=K2MBG8_TRYCR|nr:hypothetical protein MOQ_003644 [Trypanosoma cruzi marinkellei]
MLEEAVLDGKAVQLWELPARLHANESLLREFFARHFDRTPAAHIKKVVFNKNSGGNAEGKSGTSPRVGGEATVEFFESGAVHLVLSRIIQHELVERDESHHMELRRGFIYLGQDRMLVEGVVHLLQSPPVGSKAAHGSNAPAVPRNDAMPPSAKGAVAAAAVAAATTTHTAAGTNGDEKCNSNIMPGGNRGMSCGQEEEEDNDDEEEDEDEESEIDDDDDDSDPDGSERAEEERRLMSRGSEANQQTRLAGRTDAVVLCMTFVCLFDRHQHEGGAGGRLHNGDANGFGITPHVVFQLLRGICLARKIVMFNRRDLRESGGGMKQRMARALVEVSGEEDAKKVVDALHGTALELAYSGPNGDEVEYRCRIYARYNEDGRTYRQLTVPLNTTTALSVTPQNIAMMGPLLQRQRYDRDIPGNSDTAREAALSEPGAMQNRQQNQQTNYHREQDGIAVRNKENNGGGQGRRRRRRERTGGEGMQQRSNDTENVAKRSRLSPERQEFHPHGSNGEDRQGERQCAANTPEDATRPAGTTEKSNFDYNKQQWQQWQQQKQQKLEINRETQQYDNPQNPLYANVGVSATQQPDLKKPLPPGWRAIYSTEYERYYYVHRDPVTGVEVSSWELTRIS